jgi:hypothetical protein
VEKAGVERAKRHDEVLDKRRVGGVRNAVSV